MMELSDVAIAIILLIAILFAIAAERNPR